MKYENAGDVLPKELLKEIQKYVAGRLLYIPIEEKRAWGEMSGYRMQLRKRNMMIRNKYANGVTVSELADEYFLSLDSIKKIIYAKKNDQHVTYAPTVESAVEYAGTGMLKEWIQCYLTLTRNIADSLLDYMGEDQLYFGVVKFPLRLIEYDEIKSREYQAVDDDSPLPPLLIRYEEGKFHCSEQHELLDGLRKNKINAYPTIIVLQGNGDYKRFMKYYGTVLFFVN